MKKNKGFTLIELVAVLVILASISIIVTPLVMNIIKKARISADKRSIDAYGRSIELAVASYLLDTGRFPTDLSQLTIEYSGDEVICSTTQLNDDSSIYLAGCTVAGRTVSGYTYGKGNGEEEEEPETPSDAGYSVGDEVTYNEVQYYVIEDSGATEDTLTLLKAEPLSYSEVQIYSSGTGAQKYDRNGYGEMQYHSSSGAYEGSYVKTTVDAWKTAQAPLATEARLITYDELIDDLGYDPTISSAGNPQVNENVPSWVYGNYNYWTMSQLNDSSSYVWRVCSDGGLYFGSVGSNSYYQGGLVRPVIILSKSALSS